MANLRKGENMFMNYYDATVYMIWCPLSCVAVLLLHTTEVEIYFSKFRRLLSLVQ